MAGEVGRWFAYRQVLGQYWDWAWEFTPSQWHKLDKKSHCPPSNNVPLLFCLLPLKLCQVGVFSLAIFLK